MRRSPGVSRRALLQHAAALACCGGSADGPTAGRIFTVVLPSSGIRVRIPLVFNQMAVTRYDPRGGISPDVLVEETVEHFRAGHDEVLAQAVKTLGAA